MQFCRTSLDCSICGIVCRKIIDCSAVYGKYIRFWPTLLIFEPSLHGRRNRFIPALTDLEI